ncbi:hypothetical protein O181_011651 [Austropuccinia psidii MF-1]|uniref:Uncharacterized protein n=1 Tax=Austropuccinia psidii MF-1 TaxID=1389203 RepID=A0A9Q3BW55_9BASI|nr:hypothetical protein [Austropuccinia psidii MF-1]
MDEIKNIKIILWIIGWLSWTGKRLGEAEDEEGEESEENEVAAALEGAPEASESPNLAIFNQPLVPQAEENFLKMIEQTTQLMGQLTQAVSPRDNSRLNT